MRFLLLLVGILASVAIFFVFVFLGRIIEPLFMLLPEIVGDVLIAICGIAFLIAMNVWEYRSAYVKGTGKPWHFWLTFGTTIAFAMLMLSLAINGI